MTSGRESLGSAPSPMSVRRSTAAARWPFWALLAAWVCANCPQAAVYAVVTWLAEARTFSHQYELTRSVAHLLKGEPSASRVAVILHRTQAGLPDGAPAPVVPPVPPESVLRKIPLCVETISAHPRPVTGGVRLAPEAVGVPDWVRPVPLLEPPRAAAG
jgi:hypothetical protein